MTLTLSALPRLIETHHTDVRVVSFDVFDTLLWRLFSPEFVATLCSKRVHRRLTNENLAMPALDELIAERRDYFVAREMHARGAGTEWSIADWYAELAARYALGLEQVVTAGLEEELAAEIISTAPAPRLLSTLKLLRKQRLKLVALSDSQLPQTLLEALLDAHNISLDFVFSSAGTHLSKRRGNVFEHLTQSMDVRPEQILHVGDHWKSDYIQPLGNRYKAVWLPVRRVTPKAPRGLSMQTQTSRKRLREVWRALHIPHVDGADTLYRLGFNSLAPFLAIVSLWHWRQFKAHRLQSVLYLARDARLLFDAHQLLLDLFPAPPECHYIRLSRRSVSLAHPGDILQRVSDLSGRALRSHVADFLAQFDLPDDLEQGILAESGLTYTDNLTQVARGSLERGIQAHTEDIVQLQCRQRAFVQQYIRQFTGNDCRRLGIVDLGWAGTIQDAVRASMGSELSLVGLYLGLSDQGLSPTQGNYKYGLIRDDYNTSDYMNVLERTAGVVRLWELMLTEQRPTTKGLRRTTHGRIEPTYAEGFERHIDQQTLIEELHRGALDGLRARRSAIDALIKVSADWPEEIWHAAASMACRPITSKPRRTDARALLAIDYEDNSVAGDSQRHSLGFASIPTGLTWYPGILAKYRLGWLQSPLEFAADYLVKKRA